ncbi:ABC transporter permease [Mangrovibrevibacter kandeliae]|uniref:ABC transporter permease n=1 Tax=Mangrovibrevibacter kandeliae TaxID=2968473 RepID=UPI00211958B7|nr:ABC transporter permease [Aurantimonas sp. CSK15Z-1]MCQ8781570.1 ABC transporter permease [Aurantimonas sp. CSK15Z-1]
MALTTEVDDAARETELEELGGSKAARKPYWLVRAISIVLILALWEVVGRQVSPLFMSYPSAIARAAVQLTASGELWGAFLSSMETLTLGFLLATIAGVLLGLLIGRYRYVDAATDWLVNALYSTPLVAITPLVVLWFGLGFSAKLFIVFILAIFPVLINTASGVRNVPSQLIDVGNAFAASEREIFAKVILPASLPYMMTGIRLGIGRAIIGMVVAEFFTAINGLGALIIKYGNQFETAAMFVPILCLMLMGVVYTAIAIRFEHWVAPWRHTEDE